MNSRLVGTWVISRPVRTCFSLGLWRLSESFLKLSEAFVPCRRPFVTSYRGNTPNSPLPPGGRQGSLGTSRVVLAIILDAFRYHFGCFLDSEGQQWKESFAALKK